MRFLILCAIGFTSCFAFANAEMTGRWTLSQYRCDSGSFRALANTPVFFDVKFGIEGFSKRTELKNGCSYKTMHYEYALKDGKIIPQDARAKIAQVFVKCSDQVEFMDYVEMREVPFRFDGKKLSILQNKMSGCEGTEQVWVDLERD
ncbi:MAG: hypothetical protein EOP04_21160 [Proteobacteria bacterium]|nr:MAG: hypothetical protein EOP04_21160 [Pseudomonadota bacterium]